MNLKGCGNKSDFPSYQSYTSEQCDYKEFSCIQKVVNSLNYSLIAIGVLCIFQAVLLFARIILCCLLLIFFLTHF